MLKFIALKRFTCVYFCVYYGNVLIFSCFLKEPENFITRYTYMSKILVRFGFIKPMSKFL
jgi:hypothetical protein